MTPLSRNHQGGPLLDSSRDWVVYLPGDLGSDIDLGIAYPSYVSGAARRLPRLVWYSGGVLVLKDDYGNTRTMPGAAANTQWAVSPAWIVAAGLTATVVIVQW